MYGYIIKSLLYVIKMEINNILKLCCNGVLIMKNEYRFNKTNFHGAI